MVNLVELVNAGKLAPTDRRNIERIANNVGQEIWLSLDNEFDVDDDMCVAITGECERLIAKMLSEYWKCDR